MELLRIEHLTKVIGKKLIVDDLSMSVNSGEIVGFLGPNGAGKTTTIKMVVGLFTITDGQITVCGNDVEQDFEKAVANLGGIIENPDLYKNMTGRQNIEYYASLHHDVTKKDIDEVVELVKMSNRIDDKIKGYSLGMRQRIGIAQSLLHKPKLLILDEPTNGLDPLGIRELRDLLRALVMQADIGVLVSSHLLSEMELMCDRIYVIDDGKLIGEKSLTHDDTEESTYYLVNTSDNERLIEYLESIDIKYQNRADGIVVATDQKMITQVLKKMILSDIEVYTSSRIKQSLEDEFIQITQGTVDQIK